MAASGLVLLCLRGHRVLEDLDVLRRDAVGLQLRQADLDAGCERRCVRMQAREAEDRLTQVAARQQGRYAIATLGPVATRLEHLLERRLRHDEQEQVAMRLQVRDGDRKSTRLNSSHSQQSRMPSSA